jgi:diguanylate cyclase (GGDEF)-like protein/PAS domain S-box-containing protein
MSAIMDNAPVGIFFTVARRLTQYNQKCADMVGIKGGDGIGVRAREFFRSDEEYQALSRAARPLLSRGKPFQSEVYLRNRNGSDVWVNIIGYIRNPRNTSEATIWIIEDHTLQKREAERIQFLATHDALTGLSNRMLFDKMLSLAIQSATRYRRLFAVLFVDLDGFKQVNDTLGHDAGDTLLKEIAGRLVQCVRASDVVARLGGDEFAILMHELGEPQQVVPIARKILDAIAQPVTVFQSATGLDHECELTASIGVSLYPNDGKNEQALMKNADIAMYKAKQQGKNNFQFFSKDVQT